MPPSRWQLGEDANVRPTHALMATAASVALAWPATAAAAPDDAAARIEALEAQVKALSAQISELKAAMAAPSAAPPPAAAAAAPAAPPLVVATAPKPSDVKVALGGGRPSFTTNDGRFSARIRGVMQLDMAKYIQDDDLPPQVTARDLNSGANFRRARFGVDGVLFGDFSYGILLDLGSGGGAEDTGRIQDFWLQYDGLGATKLRIGAFAPNVGLADAASTNGMMLAERPAAADLSRGLAGGDFRVGVGLTTGGDRWLLAATATGPLVSNLNAGATSFNAPTFDEQQGLALRLAGTPLKGVGWLVHTGVNASVVTQPADLGASATTRYAVQLRERPELRVDGTRLVDTGAMDADGVGAYGFELAFQKKSLMFQGEYFDFRVDRRKPAPGVSDPRFNGWYLEGGWVLTGEARKYNTQTAAFDAPSIDHPFDVRTGGWGAWELAARYSVLDLDHHADSAIAADRVRGGEQEVWSVGVNWYLNPAIRFMLGVEDVSIKRRNAAGLPLDQDFQAVNLRSQFAF